MVVAGGVMDASLPIPELMRRPMKPPVGLEVAHARFLGLIVQRLLEFEAYAADLRANKHPSQSLMQVSALSHKISGVSETLGFVRVGRLSEELEQMIEQGRLVNLNAAVLWHNAEPALELLMDAMEDLLDA